jgi:hypothetical protein
MPSFCMAKCEQNFSCFEHQQCCWCEQILKAHQLILFIVHVWYTILDLAWRYGKDQHVRECKDPTFTHNRVFCKVRKTGHQYPEFGPKPGWDSKKNLQRKQSTLAFSRGVSNSQMHHFFCQTEFHHFIPKLKPCALNAEFQHFTPRLSKTSILCGPCSKRG